MSKTIDQDINNGWISSSLSEITMLNGLIRGPFGGSLKKEYFVSTGYKVYQQKNAIYKSCRLGNYYINDNKFHELRRFEVTHGDFIVSCSGTIGEIYKIPKKAPTGIINQALLLIKVDNNELNPEYFYHYFQWEKFKDLIIDKTQGGAMRNLIGMDEFRETPIKHPKSLKEQSAIAEALSDVDDLINALEELISKKKKVKKATMQRLLTGKQRLPGFDGEWEEKRLGDIADISTGDKNNQDKVQNGGYPFFVRSQDVQRINSYSFDGEAILIPGEGNIGSIFHYINGRFDYHQRVYKISNFKNNTNAIFLYLQMQLKFFNHAMTHSVKATVDSLRLPTFKNYLFKSPKTVKEQEAIATILSDMDEEIQALEKKQEKYRKIKRGMMQELLTGKTRLVVSG